MKKNLSFLTYFGVFLGIILIAASCSDPLIHAEDPNEDINLKSVSVKDADGNDLGNSVVLFAGQTINAGTLIFDDVDTDNDGTDDVLRVTYSLENNWELVNIHFWIGKSLTEMPQTRKGSPKVGAFPYNIEDVVGLTSYSFDIPLESIGFTCDSDGNYMIAAHASIQLPNGDGSYQNETAWGDGLRILQKGSWAEYFNIVITCDPTKPNVGSGQTETAWAYNADYATTFTDIIGTPRWGWTNGPLAEGTYTLDLWAAAGQNDLSKGTDVGSVVVEYSNGSATITYSTDAPYLLEEAQVYVGNDPLAKDNNGEYTIAPGQLGNNDGLLGGVSSYSYTVTGLIGDIHVQAHATVSGF